MLHELLLHPQVFVCKALLEEQAGVHVYDPQVKRDQMFVEFDYTCNVNKDNTPKLEESVRTLRVTLTCQHVLCAGAELLA